MALMLEDDMALPADLWPRVLDLVDVLPSDAHVLWLGGSRETFEGCDAYHKLRCVRQIHPPISNCSLPACGAGRLRRRHLHRPPTFLGTVAYVSTAAAAEALRGWPVRAPFDLAHSLADLLCWSDDAVGVPKSGWELVPRDRRARGARESVRQQRCHLMNQYGPPSWVLFENRTLDSGQSWVRR
eukprot:6676573-Prymnesium_polylepis.1